MLGLDVSVIPRKASLRVGKSQVKSGNKHSKYKWWRMQENFLRFLKASPRAEYGAVKKGGFGARSSRDFRYEWARKLSKIFYNFLEAHFSLLQRVSGW